MKSTKLQSVFAPGGASIVVKALCLIACIVLFMFAGFASGQASPLYGDCAVTTLGSPSFGPNPITGQYGGALNGFLPYPSDYILNTNISNAAIDPNSAALIANVQSVNHNTLHILIGSSPADGDIPYYITDSSINPNRVIPVTTAGQGQSEVMVVPYPNNDEMPIEDDSPDCSIWPDSDTNDQHSLVLDRNGCWLYEVWVTSRCPGSDLNMHYEANSLTLFDATNFNARPWGFTSSEAGGLSVYGNTVKYDEAASGVIKHPIRFTVPTSAGPNLFIIPATHGASSNTAVNKLPEGAVLRLNPARTPSMASLTAGTTDEDANVIIPALVTALQTYGMVMADNGSNMYLIGDNDPRWNDNDLGNLSQIVASDFDVIQMTPEGPGYMTGTTAHSTYYPETAPTITNFSASATGISTVSVAGVYTPPVQTPGTFTVPNTNTPVTFEVCVTGTNYNESFTGETAQPYAYIDNAGPIRIGSSGCGSITVTPKVTQEYTAYVLNTQSNYVNNGLPNLATINVQVAGTPITPAQVVFVPPPTLINGQPVGGGSGYVYAADSVKVTPITSTWAPLNTNDSAWNKTNATYFYTTATGTSATFPNVNTTTPLPTETGGTAGASTTQLGSSTTQSITVTKAAPSAGQYGYEVVCAIATVPAIGSSYGNANPSTPSCATYVFTGTSTSYANAPLILPPSGTYNTPQLISMAAPAPSTSASAFPAIFYTTDGSTPTIPTGGAAFSTAPALPTMIYAQGQDNSCYGSNYPFGAVPSCNPAGLVYATNGMTVNAITATASKTSLVTTNTYVIATSNPTFSPAAGNYVSSVAVTISDASPLATIYFTTDGTTPTSGSTPYTVPITITATTYLQAIAVQPSAANGASAGVYTIEVPAQLITPAPNTSTPLSGTSVAFGWTPGNIATHFELFVGNTGVGSSNLYNSGNVTATTETVNGLPSNAQTVNVRLYSLINGSWSSTDYTYVAYGAPTPAALTTPIPNTSTPLTGTSVAFSWTPGNVATHFEFYVGTSAGSSNLYNSGNVTATTETVSSLPSNGEKLYARLYSLINGAWQYTDYTYVAAGSPTAAVLTTPIPNTSTPLTGASVAFSWSPGNTATHFEFYVGTSVGSSNLYNSGNVTVTTETVSGLPSNGETLYARLNSLINGAWQYTDYTYVATGSPIPASLTTPTPNTTSPLTGTSVAFSWTPGNVATHFEFYVGTSVGSSNLYNSGNVTVTTETVGGLPSNGEKLYARLYSLINGAWQSTDYTYVATGSAVQAVLTTPIPNTTTPLTGTSVAFSWTPGNVATHFEFYIGTSVGSSNLYNSGNVTATTETVGGLPNNGEKLYARLYSLINGAWQYTDYTYVAAGTATPATITSPSSPSQFAGTSVTFNWTPGNSATHFELYLGTSVGASNLYNSGNVTVTTETVNGLPSNGEPIYARLYSLINGAWQYVNYTYTAF